MHTNFEKMSHFDTAVVAMIFLGLILIVVQIYISLPSKVQIAVFESVEVLDVGDTWKRPVEYGSFLFSSTRQFLDEFYIAFAEVMQVKLEVPQPIIVAYHAMQNWSDRLAYNYQTIVITQKKVDTGEVLGSYIEKVWK